MLWGKQEKQGNLFTETWLQYKNSRENPGCAEYKTHVFYQAPKSKETYLV